MPVERAASLLALQCLVRDQAPSDYTVLVVPRASLLDSVGHCAKEFLDAGRAIGSEVPLSPREREVPECVLRNLSNKDRRRCIAAEATKTALKHLIVTNDAIQRLGGRRCERESFQLSKSLGWHFRARHNLSSTSARNILVLL